MNENEINTRTIPPAPSSSNLLAPIKTLYKTPLECIEKMLDLLNLNEKSVFIDIGCGDGELLIAAAKRTGCVCFGFEINEKRAEQARSRTKQANLDHLIEIYVCDVTTMEGIEKLKACKATSIAIFLVNSNVLLETLKKANIIPKTDDKNIDSSSGSSSENGNETRNILLVSHVYKFKDLKPITIVKEKKIWCYEFESKNV